MRWSSFSAGLLLGTALLFSACASPLEERRLVSKASSGDLSFAIGSAQSVGLHPTARFAEVQAERVSEIRSLMDAALSRAMGQRGYSIAEAGEADRLLAYAIGRSTEVSDAQLREVFGVTPGIDALDGEERGGVVLVLLDAQGKQVLWRGSGAGVLGEERSTSEARVDIENAVRELLEDLPIRRSRVR